MQLYNLPYEDRQVLHMLGFQRNKHDISPDSHFLEINTPDSFKLQMETGLCKSPLGVCMNKKERTLC